MILNSLKKDGIKQLGKNSYGKFQIILVKLVGIPYLK